jgi:hypothetical protein
MADPVTVDKSIPDIHAYRFLCSSKQVAVTKTQYACKLHRGTCDTGVQDVWKLINYLVESMLL